VRLRAVSPRGAANRHSGTSSFPWRSSQRRGGGGRPIVVGRDDFWGGGCRRAAQAPIGCSRREVGDQHSTIMINAVRFEIWFSWLRGACRARANTPRSPQTARLINAEWPDFQYCCQGTRLLPGFLLALATIAAGTCGFMERPGDRWIFKWACRVGGERVRGVGAEGGIDVRRAWATGNVPRQRRRLRGGFARAPVEVTA